MKIEDKIRLKAHSKVRVFITGRKRCAKGFTVTASDGTFTTVPSKAVALQILYAVVRCTAAKQFTIKPAR